MGKPEKRNGDFSVAVSLFRWLVAQSPFDFVDEPLDAFSDRNAFDFRVRIAVLVEPEAYRRSLGLENVCNFAQLESLFRL